MIEVLATAAAAATATATAVSCRRLRPPTKRFAPPNKPGPTGLCCPAAFAYLLPQPDGRPKSWACGPLAADDACWRRAAIGCSRFCCTHPRAHKWTRRGKGQRILLNGVRQGILKQKRRNKGRKFGGGASAGICGGFSQSGSGVRRNRRTGRWRRRFE